jgi:hypothetical protein
LAKAYQLVIDRHALQELSKQRNQNGGPVGGLTQEKTNEHFAQAFDGSAARMQLALLDPKGATEAASNALYESLAGGSLCLTDAPCGAGAAAFSLLANIAQLRAENVIPRQPLDVHLIGAELSEPAKEYAREMLRELRDSLGAQAIVVHEEFLSWDVTDTMSTTDLIKSFTLAASTQKQHLLVVANFSGFLEKERKKKEAEPQLGELFRYASGPRSVAIWIEPDMNRVTGPGGLFSWIRAKLAGPWLPFARALSRGGVNLPDSTSSAKYRRPLWPSECANVRLAVMRLELDRIQ